MLNASTQRKRIQRVTGDHPGLQSFGCKICSRAFLLSKPFVSQWADICRFDQAVDSCILAATLRSLTEDSDDSAVQDAIDVLSKGVATCLDGQMAAEGYQTRGIFVGDQLRTTQNFGNGHAFILYRPLSQTYFKALPEGPPAKLRIVFLPPAPQVPS